MNQQWSFLIELSRRERRKWKRYCGRLGLGFRILSVLLNVLFWCALAIPLVPPTLLLGWLIGGSRGATLVLYFCLAVFALLVLTFVRQNSKRLGKNELAGRADLPWFRRVEVTSEYVQLSSQASWTRMSWNLASKPLIADDHVAWDHGGEIIFVSDSQLASAGGRDLFVGDMEAWRATDESDVIRAIPSVYQPGEEEWPATSLLDTPTVRQTRQADGAEDKHAGADSDRDEQVVRPSQSSRPSALFVIGTVALVLVGLSWYFNPDGLQPIWLRGLLIAAVVIWYHFLPFIYRKLIGLLPPATAAANKYDVAYQFFAAPDGIVQLCFVERVLIQETLFSRQDLRSVQLTTSAVAFACGPHQFSLPLDAVENVDAWHAQLATYENS